MDQVSNIGQLLREIRGKDSLRKAGEKTGISHNYLSIIEKGVDPRSGAPVKPSPDTLKAFSLGYNYPYTDLMKIAGYLDKEELEQEEDDVMYNAKGYEGIMKEVALKYPDVDLSDPGIRNKIMKLIDVVLEDYSKKK